jgi:predicted RNase H-like HicB family nuclease
VRVSIRIKQDTRTGFVAVCPSLPGCVSVGQTEQLARKKLLEAIRGYLASVNNFVPEQIHEELEHEYASY